MPLTAEEIEDLIIGALTQALTMRADAAYLEIQRRDPETVAKLREGAEVAEWLGRVYWPSRRTGAIRPEKRE